MCKTCRNMTRIAHELYIFFLTNYSLSAKCDAGWSVLQMNTNQYPKTVGPRAAFVVAELYERQKNIFSHADVEKISGLCSDSARGLVRRLVNRGRFRDAH